MFEGRRSEITICVINKSERETKWVLFGEMEARGRIILIPGKCEEKRTKRWGWWIGQVTGDEQISALFAISSLFYAIGLPVACPFRLYG